MPHHLYRAGESGLRAAACWGELPGKSFDSVGVDAALTAGPATFGDADLVKIEQYREPPGDSPPRMISPDAYKPLAAGRKLSYFDSATCAVTDGMTVCLLGEHGFVLEPQGSRVF